jgi:hypothetical protein
MKLSDRKIKIVFIVIVNIVLVVPFIIYSTKYLTKSYVINDKNIFLVDTISFKHVSKEITITKGSRRIEMTATNSHEFRIWNTTIDAIKDKQLFFAKVNNPNQSVIVYSDQKSAENYKNRKSSFTTIEQIEIEKIKFVDLDKVNLSEKDIALRYIFTCPILALFLTLFFRNKLLRQT